MTKQEIIILNPLKLIVKDRLSNVIISGQLLVDNTNDIRELLPDGELDSPRIESVEINLHSVYRDYDE